MWVVENYFGGGSVMFGVLWRGEDWFGGLRE